MISTNIKKFDTIVVGGGIAGLQTALDLGDQGYTVAIVEKDASIGGKMIRLSKVFPTLDCASCITTPKMSAAAHHENITLFTYCNLTSLDHNDSGEASGVKALITQNQDMLTRINVSDAGNVSMFVLYMCQMRNKAG